MHPRTPERMSGTIKKYINVTIPGYTTNGLVSGLAIGVNRSDEKIESTPHRIPYYTVPYFDSIFIVYKRIEGTI